MKDTFEIYHPINRERFTVTIGDRYEAVGCFGLTDGHKVKGTLIEQKGGMCILNGDFPYENYLIAVIPFTLKSLKSKNEMTKKSNLMPKSLAHKHVSEALMICGGWNTDEITEFLIWMDENNLEFAMGWKVKDGTIRIHDSEADCDYSMTELGYVRRHYIGGWNFTENMYQLNKQKIVNGRRIRITHPGDYRASFEILKKLVPLYRTRSWVAKRKEFNLEVN